MAVETPVRKEKPNTASARIKTSDKYSYILIPLLLFLADYLAILCAEGTALQLRNVIAPLTAGKLLKASGGHLRITDLNFYIITPVVYLVFIQMENLYTRNMQFWRVIAALFKVNLYAFFTGVFILYATKYAEVTSRLYMGLLLISSFCFLVLFRYRDGQILLIQLYFHFYFL